MGFGIIFWPSEDVLKVVVLVIGGRHFCNAHVAKEGLKVGKRVTFAHWHVFLKRYCIEFLCILGRRTSVQFSDDRKFNEGTRAFFGYKVRSQRRIRSEASGTCFQYFLGF